MQSRILRELDGVPFRKDSVGKSGAEVRLYKDRVLKIEPCSVSADNEYAMMQWLHDRLPVPEVLDREVFDGNSYLLMSRLQGSMIGIQKMKEQPMLLVQILVDTLRMLWSVDVTDSPCKDMLTFSLDIAKDSVARGLVDVDNVEPETFGEGGFESPKELLDWLISNRPKDDELVLSHGDCVPQNILMVGDKPCGIIDLGRCGIADKWKDIALCCRSIEWHTGRKAYVDAFLGMLGVEPDYAKIRYYRLLDELL